MTTGGAMGARRAHEPVELTLRLRRLDDGRLRFTTPTCPGWAYVAHRPAQIGEAVAQAWNEAAIAAYARWRGVLYDLADTEVDIPPEAYPAASQHPAEPTPPPPDEVAEKRRKRHPRTYEPEEWVELSDGYWRSPGGRRYAPHTAVVASVRAARRG